MCTESEYQSIVDRYAATMEDFEIPNGKPENARYLIARLFSVAERHVRLYTGSMAVTGQHDGQDIAIYGWPELIDNVVTFLNNKKARLQIIVQKDIDKGIDAHPMLSRLKEENLLDGKVEIRQLKPDDSLYRQGERHFLTIDDRSYRMELKEAEIKAVANFNDKVVTSTLISIFDRVFPRAVPMAPSA